jgi:NADH-quinone oxidoreductase subunit L
VSFEVGLMLFSMAVAVVGIITAYRLYIRQPDLPGILAKKYRIAYDLIFNKYYVDEIYDMAVVEPIKDGSNFLWTGVDVKVVDGAVNGSAGLVAWLSAHFRKLETGFLQNYALAIVLGVVLIVGYLVGL